MKSLWKISLRACSAERSREPRVGQPPGGRWIWGPQELGWVAGGGQFINLPSHLPKLTSWAVRAVGAGRPRVRGGDAANPAV